MRMIGPPRKSGPKSSLRKDLMEKYGLTLKHAAWARYNAAQLENCKDDSARRLLLGISEQQEVA